MEPLRESKKSSCLRLFSSVGIVSLTLASGAAAQDAAEEDLTFEEIIVTGTNIRGQDYSAPVPAEVLNLGDIRNSGVPTVTDLLTRLSVNTGSEFNTFAFAQNNTRGTAQVNLRGLGLGATLVMMNGRRMPLNASFADDGSNFVDINTVPLALIERVEVLKSGSSAIYGSDAVAGVVNFITRSDFEGVEVSGNFQTSTQGSQEDVSIDAIAGWGDDNTHVTVAASFFDRSPMLFADRDFIPLETELENIGKPGSFILLAPPGNPVFAGLPTGVPIADPNCAAAGGVPPSGPVGFCLTDSREFQPLVAEEERISLYADFKQELSDSTDFFLELSYADNEASGTTLQSFPGLSASVIVPPNNPNNPFGAPALFVGRSIGIEAGLGESVSTSETFRLATGISHELNETWQFDASFVYAENDFSNQFNDMLSANIAAALAGQGPNPGEFFNVFATSILDPSAQNSQAIIDFVAVQPVVEYESAIQVFEAGFSGTLFDLPGGSVGVAGGFQYRNTEGGFDASDELNAPRGTLTFLPPIPDFPNQGLDVYAGFVEIGAPIRENVDLQLALRYENYGGSVGDTLDPKAAIRWDITDSLTLRGSAGTSFRAPTPLQLGGSTTQVTPLINPCTGQRSAAAVITDGNPNLSPENSTSFGAGFTFQRDSFRASVDYYNYSYEDIITRLNPQAVVSAASCEMIRPGLMAPVSANVVLNPASGAIAQVNTDFFNAGAIDTDGIDFNVGYRFPIGSEGGLDVDVTATLITSFDIQETPGGAVINGLDRRNRLNLARSTPDFRMNANFIYQQGNHQLGLMVRYIDGYQDDLNAFAAVDSFTTLDLQYSLTFDEGLFGVGSETALTVGALNLTDEDPPFVDDRGAYDPQVHDPRGRLIYVRLRQGF